MRAARLRDLACEQTEERLLQAAVWLELRPDARGSSRTCEMIALHYLLLSEHPAVLRQPGLPERYRERAWIWADQAEFGAMTLGMLLERARVDA